MSTSETLFTAITSGDLERVQSMTAASASLLDATNAQGVTAIMVALYHGKQNIAAALAERKGDLNLFEAAAMGRMERVRDLIDDDVSRIDAISPDGFPLVSLAAFFGQFAAAELLIDRGANVNAVSTNGMNLRPIHAAAARSAEPTMRKLLAAGADPNAQQQGGWTALHSAAKHGNQALVDLLLEYEADASIRSDDDKTARDLAVEAGHDRVATRLDERAA
ncbi:MAG: ankyrin repeat domain-containing protein [Phycisphaerales bacterium]|nr:ankyrin repeat domain-containing protein [Phycisphaerales bacterium]MCB9857295.1 ankyrin repeat domain-containing protein [Phycisphaerales bacterium]MCB9862991.1 ankyrin repeat domain-containing protein [Phycisphaerales bacterium]